MPESKRNVESKLEMLFPEDSVEAGDTPLQISEDNSIEHLIKFEDGEEEKSSNHFDNP